MNLLVPILGGALAMAIGCVQRPVENPNIIILGVTSGPNDLDPRIGSDDTSQKLGQLIFSSLMTLDEHLGSDHRKGTRGFTDAFLERMHTQLHDHKHEAPEHADRWTPSGVRACPLPPASATRTRATAGA